MHARLTSACSAARRRAWLAEGEPLTIPAARLTVPDASREFLEQVPHKNSVEEYLGRQVYACRPRQVARFPEALLGLRWRADANRTRAGNLTPASRSLSARSSRLSKCPRDSRAPSTFPVSRQAPAKSSCRAGSAKAPANPRAAWKCSAAVATAPAARAWRPAAARTAMALGSPLRWAPRAWGAASAGVAPSSNNVMSALA